MGPAVGILLLIVVALGSVWMFIERTKRIARNVRRFKGQKPKSPEGWQ
jgi:hypothetical protein